VFHLDTASINNPLDFKRRRIIDIALIKCTECGREISDKAEICLGCGAPISVSVKQQSHVPTTVHYNPATDTFTGTNILMTKLAMRAIQELEWKLDQANEAIGMVTFETGISWGSWSGVSCSLNIEEMSPIYSVSLERGNRISVVVSS
jgi:uncharacterized OB-fold protein